MSQITPQVSRFVRHASWRVFLLALLAYGLSAQVWSHAVSLTPHYVYLAQSLLHGHVDLIQLPPTTYDLLRFNGRWFIAESPMPSIMMLPFVAIFGVGFSDVLFSIVLGAIDVVLVYSLLGVFTRHRAADTQREEEETPYRDTSAVITESARRWITLLFALGTPFWYLASLGPYWFMAHIVVVFFALLATREALTKQRWFLVGLWLACAGSARLTAFFLAPFFLIVILYTSRDRHDASRSVRRYAVQFTPHVLRSLLAFVLALALGIGANLAYNYVRFKSFTDFGYPYITGADNITSVYARYGGFNPRFVPCNLAVSLLSPPEVNGAVPAFITQTCAYLLKGVNLSDASAPITPNPLGMSVFFVTPALLIVFAPLATNLKRRLFSARSSFDSASFCSSRIAAESGAARQVGWELLSLAAWIGLLATFIPLWLYHNTGSLQFGWRYLLDAAPMWIILLAAGMQKVTKFKQGLIFVSLAINLWGFLWMFEKLNGTNWWQF